jgi:hypothetical protein
MTAAGIYRAESTPARVARPTSTPPAAPAHGTDPVRSGMTGTPLPHHRRDTFPSVTIGG